MTQPITHKASKHQMRQQLVNPTVIKTELADGIVAEANLDGTIFVDKKASPAKAKEAVKHEKIHLDQMSRGDLSYDSQNVYWRGKIYKRENMNEGAHSLPWEQEAYNRTKK
jgi:hypothetical protein